jgi:hypothetical protein
MDLPEMRVLIKKQRAGGMTQEETKGILELLVKSNGCVPMADALTELDFIYKQKARVETLTDKIRAWVQKEISNAKVVHSKDCDSDLDIVSNSDKNNRRQVFCKLCQEGMLQLVRYGEYKAIEYDAPEIPVDNVDFSKTLDIILPFGLHNWTILYPRNLIIIAGDTDSGKSAFCLQVLKLNNNGKMPIRYFNSEMGAEELRRRMDKLGVEKWSFRPRERDSDFASVIDPNGLNVIDYMELTDKFFLVAEEFKKMTAKLKTGICVIAMQKKFGAQLAYGAESTLWKARLYLSMSYDKNTRTGKLDVVKAKNPKIETVNIKGWQWEFELQSGTEFKILSEPDEITEEVNQNEEY